MAFADTQSGAIIYDGANSIRNVTLAGTVTKGDAVGYSSGWKRALGDVSGVIQCRGIAMADGVSGDNIPVCFGRCMITGRYTGGTVLANLYVAEGTDNGKITETAPSTQNDSNRVIGIVIDATTVCLRPNANVDSLVP